ncbi:MAG: ABC transporter permease [Desulfobacteraceae bacterium]|nr:ABC transporter permease [Desulfobacteraceae bacterium]
MKGETAAPTRGGGAGGRSMRLKGLVRKEALQILRDPSSIGIAFVLPLILLLIFGYGVSLDATHVPLAVVVEQPTRQTAAFTAGLAQSEYFDPRGYSDVRAAENALQRGEVDGIVWLRDEFSRKVLAGGAPGIGVFVNGVDANTARIIEGYLQGVWSNWQAAASKGGPYFPVKLEQRVWFNPGLRSRDFLVPGLVAVIMTLIGALLTAMVVAREWERGTMEALLVTPVRVPEILLGKLIPYFLLGMGGLLFSVGMAVWLFAVPLRGSLWVLLAASALFLLTALGMGLLISTVARSQFVAGQVAIVATFLPAFILSGFIFDINSMPAPIQLLTRILPARYYVAILQTVFLAGNIWPVVLLNGLALLAMGAFFLILVRRKTRKRLQ